VLKKRATHLITIIQNVIRFRGPTFVFAGKREEEERTKKGQSIERQTNLLVVVQFFFETKLLLFLNCVCGSCCAIDIVRVACCCYVCGFPEEGVRVRKKREDKKSELKPYTQSSSVPEKTLLT